MRFYQIRVKCIPKALILICLLLSVQHAIQVTRIRLTPCPGVFYYEEGEADDDRWYGEITLKINKTVEGATVRIILDKPSYLLVSWAGLVTSRDNTLYIANHDNAVLYAGNIYKFRIMVRFNKNESVPMLKSIDFNGVQICPKDSVNDQSGSRPDFDAFEPTDVDSDLYKRTTTSKTTTKLRPGPVETSNNVVVNKNPSGNNNINPNNIGVGNPTNKTPNNQDSDADLKPNNFNNNGEENFTNFNEGATNINNYNQDNSHINNALSSGNLNPVKGNSNGNVNQKNVSCGTVSVVNPLVTNGKNTHRGQWPWHIALYKAEGINLNYLCGGSLISKNKVITAAHCLVSPPGNKIVSYKSLVVYLGKFNLRQYSGETGVQTKEVSRLNINPTYNSTNFGGDIAILTLNTDVEYSNYVRPICVWEAEDSISNIEGREGVVAGWGFTEYEQASEELKMAALPVVSTETCLRSYPKFYSEYLSDTAFCAGFRNGTSPCNGDSGGGLVFKRNKDTWYLRGIVSLSVAKGGLNFCDTNYYVIFTDVARYTDFIRQNSS